MTTDGASEEPNSTRDQGGTSPAPPPTDGASDAPESRDGVAVTTPPPRTQTRSGFYQMTPEDRKMVFDAKHSGDVPLRVRNKLYSAIGRHMARPTVQKHMLAEWSAA